MAFKSSRPAASISRQALKRYRPQHAAPITRPVASTCSFSTSSPRCAEDAEEVPRWAKTPERMKAPFSQHIIKDPRRSIWHVNDDPNKLDEALDNFLGRDGCKLLPEELKWQAVTHKTFDHGRRGFNDRLAFLGRQICIQEAVQYIINSPKAELPNDHFSDLREPVQDPALRNVDNLAKIQPSDIWSLPQMAKVALDTGLSAVIRWKPRLPENLPGSGLDAVLVGTMYSLIGAIALQHGGRVASRVVRERILKKLRPVTSSPPPS
ncbi:RNase III domain-containing protein [Xylariaceae sp. FL1019]|nr:RNase III domain-containing protein [Xylariaceae sp. FL1019]